jgi:hypothetical protein
LRKRALQAEHEAVVEVGGVVAAILVDHQRAGYGAQLELAMPVLVGARQARVAMPVFRPIRIIGLTTNAYSRLSLNNGRAVPETRTVAQCQRDQLQ